MASPVANDVELTRDELQAEAEGLAREVLQTSASDAWKRVRKGELEGTFFAARLSQIFFLLGETSPDGGASHAHAQHAAE